MIAEEAARDAVREFSVDVIGFRHDHPPPLGSYPSDLLQYVALRRARTIAVRTFLGRAIWAIVVGITGLIGTIAGPLIWKYLGLPQ